MNLISETLLISGLMTVLCSLPLLSSRVRKHSKLFFLLGTGALVGIFAFDLVPDLLSLGGHSSLLPMIGVWVVYSITHLNHLKHHKQESHGEHVHGEGRSYLFFLLAMVAHCMASGMLLVVSVGLAKGFEHTVFFALLAHKSYEALTVSSVLIEKSKSKKGSIVAIAVYALALPAGVLLTSRVQATITQAVAVFATSLAMGTLLGCLMYDFLIPSFKQIKKRRHDVGWIALGLLATQLMMRAL